ncbi:hypothetical protein D3C85_1074850 [compost metagenome]
MVMVLSIDRIILKILQSIIHPTHHPFHSKAKPPGMYRMCYARISAAFLSNSLYSFIITIHCFIQVF